MIEISHQQAQQFIRDSIDRGRKTSGSRLTQEQWAALQEHLDTCAECRQYGQRMQSLERDISRALQARLGTVNGPRPGIFRSLIDQRQAAKNRRSRIARALPWAAALLALVGILLVRPLLMPAVPTVTPTPTLAVPPTATPLSPPRGEFRGLLAFEARRDGNAEIYLLNAGPTETDLTNLTASPAQDTSPAWSPDGEWIAFLSDRDGKNEVYVISVAGSRLTRLTADPNLAWLGPLSWSSDGRWIAARAAREDQQKEIYVYLVSLNGQIAPRSVAYSRGSPAAPLFSPLSNYLAFQAANPPGVIYDYSVATGWYSAFNSYDVYFSQMRSANVYNWTAGGSSLVYVAEGPGENREPSQGPVTRVNISPGMIESSTTSAVSSSPWVVSEVEGAGGAVSAAVMGPGGLTVMYAQDEDGDGCWSLHLQQVYQPLEEPVDVEGICLEGGLTRLSWQPGVQNGAAWVFMLARRQDERAPAIFAARFEQMLTLESLSPLRIPTEIINTPGLAITEDPSTWPGDPLPRPAGRRLNINPVPAVESVARLEPSIPAIETAGGLVVVQSAVGGSALALVRPDGSQQVLVGAAQSPSCPALSPDGERIAYLTGPVSPGGDTLLEVVPSDGGRPLRVTGPGSAAGEAPGSGNASRAYGCPVWSPDGGLLAAEYNDGNFTYLAVLSADDSAKAAFLRIEPPSVPPVWTRSVDGNGPLLLVYPETTGLPVRVVSIDLSSTQNQEAIFFSMRADAQVLATLPEVDAVTAFTASPDGAKIALVGVVYQFSQSTTLRGASFITGTPGEQLSFFPLEGYNPALAGSRSLSWLDGDRVGLFQPLPLNNHVKAYLKLYQPQLGALVTVASFSDLVTGVAWARDASRVYSASESGLWAQDVQAGLSGAASPARIAGDWVSEVILNR